MVKNFMEIVLEHMLPGVLLQYPEQCKCEKCIDDIKAIALNKLKPLYMVTEKGNVFLRLNELELQFKTDILRELIQAISLVSKNQKHN